MDKIGWRNQGHRVNRPLDLEEFYRRLHSCIGGSGPRGLAWDLELPSRDLSSTEFRTEYLWSEIASKFESGSISPQRRKTDAIAQFRESEEACKAANRNLGCGSYRATPLLLSGLTLDAVLFTAAGKISSLLGRFCWSRCVDGMAFGPGASFSLPRAVAFPWSKFETNLDVNPQSVPLALAVLAEQPAWCRSLIEQGACIVPNAKNRLTTVPKNYKRDRTIAIEPLMGIYIQKGIGAFIRRRLKRVGINLDDQSANQLGAFVGSISGELATIDLKSASDTISIGIVEQLLPPDWFQALEQCRSQLGVLGSEERILYRKFSSMGNGFTFELETLIFWALGSAVSDLLRLKDRRLLVYGDDIIFPSSHAEEFVEVLEWCGFTPNRKKTHLSGPFRESCGKHYLAGIDVTPFYIRRNIETEDDLFLLHNNLTRWCARASLQSPSAYRESFGGSIPSLLSWIRGHSSVCNRPTICDGFGDSAFIGDFDETTPKFLQWYPSARSKEPSHSCQHFACYHWPNQAVVREVSNGGLLPLMLARQAETDSVFFFDSATDPCQQWLRDWAYRVGSTCEVPPPSRVLARKRARKILRVPLVLWKEMGPWA